MTVAAYTKARLEDELSGNGLSPLQNRALALLIESHLPLPQIAQELGINRQRLWEIRKAPDFQAAYRAQMAILETSAMQYAISQRVERIAALDHRWRQITAELDKRKAPRADLVYVQIALQAEARKEIEGDVRRVEVGGRLEVTQQVNVIRFEALPPRDLSESDVIEGEFAELSEPDRGSDATFLRAVQAVGIRSESGVAQPEELAAIREAIRERGLDPRAVLSDSQFEALYGRGKGVDPWASETH